MNYRMFAVCLFAIVGSYLIFSMPLAFATDVSIYHGGQLKGSAQISPQNMVNKQVVVSHQESDVTWSDTKILVRVSTASLANSIKKIYLYKCKKLDPNACMQTMPQSFDNWVDTELAWSDISEQQGAASYPQIANILVLVKMEGANKRVGWMAFWDTVKRLDYNVFNEYSYEISSIDVYAKSADLVSPIQSYIGNFQMVPFNWVSKVVFNSASTLYGGGGDAQDLDKAQPSLETAQTTNQITAINKDYYFIFSNISSGITNALTMNLNPSFTCGDGECEADLGETTESCCFDCGCGDGQYCDITSGTSGSCRQTNATTLSVTGYTVPTPLQQCSARMTANITARIDNPPSSLQPAITGYFRINSTQYPASCTGSGGVYNCPLSIQPPVSCGFGTFSLGPNTLNMSISYRDGPNTVLKDLSTQFSNINVNYDCGCPTNFYCDIGPNVCRSEGSIMLQVLSVTSYLDNFSGANDMVKAVLRINNAPTNFTANAFTFVFGNITWDGSSVPASHPTVNCLNTEVSGSSYTYNCSAPLSIASYDNSNQYVVRGNSVNASITYTDGGVSKQTVLSAPFGDIIVPQQSCGNGRVDPQETQSNCCRDAGCPSAGQYCDIEYGCKYVANITASVLNVLPTNVSDCTIPHMINFTVKINNAPSDANLNFYSYLRNGLAQGWAMQCSQPAQFTGIVYCYLTMPPQENCSLPFSTISGNSLNLSISFRNGDRETLTKEMNAPFQDFTVTPAWHCGDRSCESGIGESAANCCIDCSCKDSADFGSDYYCNYDPENIVNGSCESKSNITLVIDNPKSTVTFKTCEYDNTVDIRAHIEKQPTYVSVENFYGTLKGESAEMSCVQDRLFAGSNNFTLSCQMLVPAEQECAKGKVFTYDDNSMGVFISYRDGLGGMVTQTLSAPLPAFKATQSYKSLNQIAEEAVEKMKDNMEKMLSLTKKLLKWIKTCITIAMAIIIAEIALAVWAGYKGLKGTSSTTTTTTGMGGTTTSTTTTPGSWQQAGENIKTVAVIGGGIMQSWMAICNMMEKYYDVMQKTLSVENEILKMDLCIQVYQHMLDAGQCRSGGMSSMEGCFNALMSCVNYNTVSSYMSGINGDMRQMSGFATQAAQGLAVVGEGLEYLGGGGGNAQLSLLMKDSRSLNQPDKNIKSFQACDRYPSASSAYTSYGSAEDILQVIVMKGSACNYPIVLVGSEKYEDGKTIEKRIDNMGGTTFDFKLYCFYSADQFLRVQPGDMDKYERDHASVTVVSDVADGAEDGSCWGTTTSTSGTFNRDFLRQKKNEIDSIKSRVNALEITGSASSKDIVKTELDDAMTLITHAADIIDTNMAEAKTNTYSARDKLNSAKNNLDNVPAVSATTRSLIKDDLQNIINQLNNAAGTAGGSGGSSGTTTGCCMTTLSGCLDKTQTDCASIGGTFSAGKTCDKEGVGGACI